MKVAKTPFFWFEMIYLAITRKHKAVYSWTLIKAWAPDPDFLSLLGTLPLPAHIGP